MSVTNPAALRQPSPMGQTGEDQRIETSFHRYALKGDIPSVYAMYLDALSELNQQYDEEKAFEFVVNNWLLVPCIVLEKDREIVGFCGLTTVEMGFSREIKLRDYMFYLTPENRTIKNLMLLCEGAREVADKIGCELFIEYVFEKMEGQLRLMGMAKFEPIGIIGRYRGKNE